MSGYVKVHNRVAIAEHNAVIASKRRRDLCWVYDVMHGPHVYEGRINGGYIDAASIDEELELAGVITVNSRYSDNSLPIYDIHLDKLEVWFAAEMLIASEVTS